MTETFEASSALKRKASPSPPAEDVAPKRVKAGETGEAVENDEQSNGKKNDLRNGAFSEKHKLEDAPPSKQVKGGPESPIALRSSSPDKKPIDLETDSRSPKQARRPSTLMGGPGTRRNLVPQEEKKRAARLFGGLISTLSQKPSNTQQKRRQEIERRQQERIQQQRAQGDRRRAEKLAERKALWKAAEDDLEEEIMHARHRKILGLAHSLKTAAEPALYYRPWELTESQEFAIDEQIRQAKETIERELREFRVRKGAISENSHSHSRRASGPKGLDGAPYAKSETTVSERKGSLEDANRGAATSAQKDHDENVDEMVQDKEDTVLY